MESRSVKQLPPEGKVKERMKEADDVRLDVAEDTDKGEMEGEHDAGARMNTGCRSPEHDRVHEYVTARSLVENVKEKCFIHKVHSGLRTGSAKHYEPVLVSIGPYHHGKCSVQDMEKHKVRYMQVLLDRKEEKSMDKYIEALRNEKEESKALDCYVDAYPMDADSFGECMVLDGLFMIELFRRNMNPQDYEQTTEEGNFVPLMLGYFRFNGKPIPYHGGLTTPLDDIPHLLGLVYEALVSRKNEFSVPETAVQLNRKRKSLKSIIWTGLVRLIEKALVLKTAQQPSTEWRSCEFIWAAVALEQVGVIFVKAHYYAAFYDIQFSHGVLSIPRLVIDDNTESFFRNLVAYEQYSEQNRLHRVVDYLQVMACLINTGKDVKLLRHCGIIENRIGDDKKVSAMFNDLCSNVYFDQDRFFYSKMFEDVNEFCKDRRNVWMAKLNVWMAKLKSEYFGSPWSVISFLAAVLLLLLAALQTGYTVASYYK